MMRNILIMSDIHGNISALKTVLQRVPLDDLDGIVLLGDLIDYGPHSNEVIECLQKIPEELVIVNIWGNHEHAIVNAEYSRFSSERGKACAGITREQLNQNTWEYLEKMEKSGYKEFELLGKKCLAVHGSMKDNYWKSIFSGESDDIYAAYDMVFSGHSHLPHYFSQWYASENEEYRNKKKTIFINPGSVGQPRNHNPNAHYAILDMDSMSVQLNSVSYDIEYELQAFSDKVDKFYKERLIRGI